MFHWRKNTRTAPDAQPFHGDHTEDEFLATIANFDGGKWMPAIEDTASRVAALANIVSTHVGPDHLSIVARDPAPFDTIASLTGDVREVEVIVATTVSPNDAERFREARDAERFPRAFYDRHGNPDGQNVAKAKGLAADIGITTPPTLSAIMGTMLGVLFATVEDAQAYDRAG
ncbi:hypothetical protein NHF48_019865 [Sphingomonas sp. H160509]|uniref:hypothetical protein n=1 Tax=Sphingomonas sp. H160509 TaxID=2955313 RepID=UPI0021E76198|nr:hypothetical protein [Sphingomonas sp. H160509]MDD1452676.1 hypothetical protein [Sphingomonas sp. H160509]